MASVLGRSPGPAYSLKVAESKDEIEACYDIRIEGEYAIWLLVLLPFRG